LRGSVAAGVRGGGTVFSDYSAILAARLGSVVLSLCSVLMSTRILQPTGYGIVAYFTVVAMLIFTVTSAWTSTAVARYGREELERDGSMTGVTWARFTLTVPLMVVATICVPLLKVAGALPAAFPWSLTVLAVVFGALCVASEHVTYMLEAAGRMKLSAVGMLLQQALVVAGLAVILVVGGRSPVTIAWLSVGATLAVTLAFGWQIRRVAFWPPLFDRALLKRIVAFSLPMVAFTVSQYVIRSVDLVVIQAYGSAVSVGVYAVAYQGYTVLQSLAAAAPPVLTPLFVSLQEANNDTVIRRYLERVVPQITFAASVAAGLCIPLIPVFVPIVFGRAFADASTPLAILMVAWVLFFVSNLLAPIIVLHERTRAVGAINVAAAVANIVLDVILIGPLDAGITGAAIATTVALGMIVAVYLRTARSCVRARSHLWIVATPVVAGLVPALTLDGAAAVGAGVAAVAASAAVIQILIRPFAAEDANLVAALDIPGPVKRIVLRALAHAGQRR
jgi:O-antigen/teichoic acid export membrane protein